MASTASPAKTRTTPPIRFVKQYTVVSGRVFMRFETPDGECATDIVVREDRKGPWLHTRAEAKILAMRELGITVPCPNGCPDQVVPGAWIDPEYCAKRQDVAA
jgi:hypothetical protein